MPQREADDYSEDDDHFDNREEESEHDSIKDETIE